MDLIKFINLTSETESIDDLYALLEQALEHICGYDRVIFSLMTDHNSIGLEAGHGIMRNYPDDWMKYYVEKGYEHIDPVRRFGFRAVGPFLWDRLPLVMELTPEQKTCMNECADAGFSNGAAVCLRGMVGEVGGIGVASSGSQKLDSDEEANHKLSMLNVIAQQFYTRFCMLHAQEGSDFPPEVVLTKREIEVLKKIALAEKDDAIAYDLNISRHAVDYHVRNILKKFNAPNRMHAVVRAIHSGVLGLDNAVFIRKSKR